MNSLTTIITISFIMSLIANSTFGSPISETAATELSDENTEQPLSASLNDTPKNLYVIKAVVYEIGILTEADENETSFESQERVDLTFFDAHTNESHIDLGNVPLPIQTNVSGQVLTGIAPVNIGAFKSPDELLTTLPLTGTIVNITHSDTAFYTLKTTNATSPAEKPHAVTHDDISKISNGPSLFANFGDLSEHEAHDDIEENNENNQKQDEN